MSIDTKLKFQLFLIILTLIVFSSIIYAQSIPPYIHYQGRLLDKETNSPITQSKHITFSFYGTETEEIPIYYQTQEVSITNGIFFVFIGKGEGFYDGNIITDGIPAQVFTEHSAWYLGIKLEDSQIEMEPRQIIATVAYAFKAEKAKEAENVMGQVIVNPSSGNVGIGMTSPSKKLDVAGDVNFTGNLYKGGALFSGSKWTKSEDNIYYIGSSLGEGTGTTSTVATGLSNISGIAVDSSGTIYAATSWDGLYKIVDRTNTQIASGFGRFLALYDADFANNELWVVYQHAIQRVTTSGTKESTFAVASCPTGLARDLQNGDMYSVSAGDCGPKIVKTTTGGVATTLSTDGYGWVVDLNFGPNRKLYAIAGNPGTEIWEINLDGSHTTFKSDSRFTSLRDMAMDSSGNMYVTNSSDGIIYKINFSDKAVSVFFSGLTNPRMITISPSGDFYVSTGTNITKITFSEGSGIGNVGIGTMSPGSKLEVAGMIHSTSNGFKFPDGTVQTTAVTNGSGDGHSLDAADGDPVDAVYVDNEGNVGMPEGSLSVSGPGVFEGSNKIGNLLQPPEVLYETRGGMSTVIQGDLTINGQTASVGSIQSCHGGLLIISCYKEIWREMTGHNTVWLYLVAAGARHFAWAEATLISTHQVGGGAGCSVSGGTQGQPLVITNNNSTGTVVHYRAVLIH